MKYAKKTAIIIGGTHGMGLATARQLVDQGATVLVTGNDERNIVAARQALGAEARVVRSDVSSLTEIDQLATTVQEAMTTVDALFVFAAVAEFSSFSDVTEAHFDRHFAINTKGVFFTVQRLLPLLNDGGSITLATVTQATASPTMSVYMASKAAVRAFAQVLAAEVLDRKIRVNTLAPGFIDTPSLGLAGLTPEEREAFRAIGDQVTPMKRHGTSEEVARAALFLAFEATFTTGAELPVDGGIAQVDVPQA